MTAGDGGATLPDRIAGGRHWLWPLVAFVVLTVVVLATWLPARRAGLVDPLSMLRAE